MIKVSLIWSILLWVALASCRTPDNVTILNDLRDFNPLLFGDDFDYFVSTKTATAEEAQKVCESIGKNFHLVSFENETEYRRLLPYLRSLEMSKVWTSGVKYQNSNSTSQYVWTHPSPSVPITFSNFPSGPMLAKLTRLESLGKEDLPRCRNGFLSPRCTPGNCHVTLPPCTTVTPDCVITDVPPCTVTRPECGASCNNCTIENPVCHVVQENCQVHVQPCTVIRKDCTLQTPQCHTFRPDCTTVYPPCHVTAPNTPCTTTPSPCATTRHDCTTTQSPCSGGNEKCPPPVTFCKTIFKCNPEPEICQPGPIFCPTPITTCPPEQTICKPPVLHCPTPLIDCPDPDVYCPPPKAECSKPKITCAAPEVSCPGIVLNCPAPTFHCPASHVTCPDPVIDCEPTAPCDDTTTPVPCPSNDPNGFINEDDESGETEGVLVPSECDDCLPNGCIALRKQTDFKYKLQNCSDKLHFLCEGR